MAIDWMRAVHGSPARSLPAFNTGDRVRVWYQILEQGKERLGQFEGDVIRTRGSGPSRTFTVRRVTYGEGVERVFPFDSSTIARVEVLQQGKVRRSRLYYLRRVVGKTRIAAADGGGESSPTTPASAKSTVHAETAVGAAEQPAAAGRPSGRAAATP
jgi:large subunit ribosomal protein L19